jgi:mannose/cellobiose epimerase-like protein (N-acyl-D-glucosamine 2-epimerase family)
MTGTPSESEAPRHIRPGTWLEPFALRALGQVREDDELIRQALALFEAMGLDWHAAETRKWLTDGA